ncbi:Fungal-trans domain-containing protein [Fusarium falciforme]|uniref:Fungal-trans domain-containing protein n=1 Tax=Fusarium falciforme TaxID=195108 RepID=UPI00230016CB|nr:Fungal-trans domain-containing protein [Fusarium falciforme]WAO85030.1 Fungal-trans domain-containing protein [Fusarium falciforme]
MTRLELFPRRCKRLRRRVEELESQLEEARRHVASLPSGIPTPTHSTPSSTELQLYRSPSSPTPAPSPPKRQWEGIYTASGRSDQTSYYGPSSSHYFIGRIGCFLSQAFHQPLQHRCMEPKGMNRRLDDPTSQEDAISRTDRRAEVPKPSMSRMQEEYFLNLFWESHHANIPIIQEGEFRKLHNSLWSDSSSYRKPSALVDIILAISMQYGCAFLLRGSGANSRDQDDASIAGRWYYRRCQTLLASELESPSITTLQCHLFSVVYLCCASFQNMAHSTLAAAMSVAQTLGLHLEPPASMPRAEKELRKRLWWATFINDSKTALKVGRPLSVQRSQITVSPISDDEEAASFFDSSLGSYDGVTWLTYAAQNQKLIIVSTDIHDAFYERCSEILGQSSHSTPYKNSKDLESCAKFITSQLPALQAWADQVPPGLRLQRRDSGAPFSADRTPILIDSCAPLWLQRHRICLELIYHTLQSNLHRPFINFAPPPGTYTPTAERHAVTCANHAAAYTHILHQTLQETDIMNGWQEFFIWQWNATVNMIGFVLACPINAATSSVRRAIDKAVEVFEVFGRDFAIAASAASVTKNLTTKADLLMDQLRSGITAGAETGVVDGVAGMTVGERDNVQTGQTAEEGLTEFMDWALTVDSFNNFEDLFVDVNKSMDFWGVNPV